MSLAFDESAYHEPDSRRQKTKTNSPNRRLMTAGFGWYARSVATVTTLVPWLEQDCTDLRTYMEEVPTHRLCSAEAWAVLKPQIDAPAEIIRMDELFARESVLLEFVAGDTVSIVVTGHLLARFPTGGLAGNSKSDYPDLFIKTNDYSKLPVRTRNDQEIGERLAAATASRFECRMDWKSRPSVTTRTSIAITHTSAFISCSPSLPPASAWS